MTISWQKFHPLFGNDLRVALSLEVPVGLEKEISPQDGLVQSKTTDLIHRNGTVIRYSYPAVVEGNILIADKGEIKFINWLNYGIVSDDFKYGLTLWAKNSKNLRILFGRHGEERAFSFGERYHIHLALQNKVVKAFNPVFVKALKIDTSNIVNFVIEASLLREKTLRFRQVIENEMPICLQGEYL